MSCAGAPLSRSRPWYGATAAWWVPFQRDARRKYGEQIQIVHGLDTLAYKTKLEVPGLESLVPVTIRFYAEPPYDTYGLSPQDYPRICAAADDPSPHRMPDRSLCLYHPHDPLEQRWRSDLGLLSLINLTRDHLFFEHYWRSTGGHDGGIWLGHEAEHGFQASRTRDGTGAVRELDQQYVRHGH